MGQYSTVYIDNSPIHVFKDEINFSTIGLFEESDFISYSSQSVQEDLFPTYHDDFFGLDELHNRYHFITTVQLILDKLTVLGYTLESTKIEFEVNRLQLLNEATNDFNECSDNTYAEARYARTIQFLKKASFELFYDYVLGLVSNESAEVESDYRALWSIGVLAFFKYEPRFLYRLIIEECGTEDKFAYDITEQHIVWFTEEMKELANPYSKYTSDIFTQIEVGFRKKIIILTEGKSDVSCLGKSLDLLFPHLKRYYGFLDYTVSGTGLGGASTTVKLLKSLIAAGSSDYYVAVFDNDLAGKEAIDSIGDNLPYNFRAIQYPAIELLENYPVIGPTGVTIFNINGLGGSLEMYFGVDVLEVEGKLELAKWTGYNSKFKLYQSSLINKSSVQDRFYEKVKKGIQHGSDKEVLWRDMTTLLNEIFSAFKQPLK